MYEIFWKLKKSIKNYYVPNVIAFHLNYLSDEVEGFDEPVSLDSTPSSFFKSTDSGTSNFDVPEIQYKTDIKNNLKVLMKSLFTLTAC